MTDQCFVRLASPCDKSAVEALLRAGFGDEEEFLCAFFDHLYPTCETLLSVDDGCIAAMAALIPCKVIQPGSPSHDALYLYSLTTLPAFRGRGHAQRLLNAAQEKCHSVFLHAADDSLFRMYASRGWRSMMHVRWQNEHAAKPLSPIIPQSGYDYLAMRERLLQATPHIAWNESTGCFLHDLLCGYDGGLYASNGAIAAVIDRTDDSRLYLAEALGENAAQLAQGLAHMHSCNHSYILTPCTADAPGAFPYAQGVGEEIPDPIQLSFVFL